jgi:predicted esterase
MKALQVATRIHGRVLVREAADPAAVIIGFHGYMENADSQMDRLVSMPGSDRWTLVSVQGLHRFYRGRSEEVVASWMTRQDRDEAIADNIEYYDRVVEAVAPPGARIVTTGFSQGVAMAFRGAVRGSRRAAAIIAVGGDVPPELLDDAASAFPAVLLARGDRDDWYTTGKLKGDVNALQARDVPLETFVYPGAHEWTPDVAVAASTFIRLRT